MDIQIHAVHFTADQKLVDYVKNKMTKAEHFFNQVINAEVFLKLEHGNALMKDKVVEVRISVPHKMLFSEERSFLFEESVDLAIDSICRQIKKHKERLRG